MTDALLGPGGEVSATDFDVVVLEGEEALSEPFRFRLLLLPKGDLSAADLVGSRLALELVGSKRGPRRLGGIVTRVRRRGEDLLEAELEPWLALLGRHVDQRIFQHLAVPELVQRLAAAFGFGTVRSDLVQSYPERDYCVQYAETTLDFVSRLLEDAGIGYRIDCSDGADTLVLVDDASAFPASAVDEALAFRPLPPGAEWLEDERIATVEAEYRLLPHRWSSDDYADATPNAPLEVATGEGALELFEHPGGYTTHDDGLARVRVRREAGELDAMRIVGTSPLRHFAPGVRFEMTDHPNASLNQAYVIRRVRHELRRGSYRNQFEAFPLATPFRPPRRTPLPRIRGPQTAVVVGPEGDEIHCDEQGRVKVRFHWDRGETDDADASCYVRVAQSFAGPGFGGFVLPRIGQEVVVSFLGGDPDRPLVTGAVYNGHNAPPLILPDENTKIAFTSRSTPEGRTGNRLVVEDKAGKEAIEVYASRNLDIEVEADQSLTVTTGNRTVSVAQGDETYTVKGKRDLSIGGAENHTTSGGFSQSVGGAYSLAAGSDVTIQAGGTLTLKTAGGSLVIDPAGNVALSANLNLTLKGELNANLEAGVQLTVKGKGLGTLDGGGMLTIKGGMVMIN